MEPLPPAPAAELEEQQPQPGGQYSDEFMMYIFKVEMCKRVDKHDREKCPYAHPGELARRRHPSLYQALPCPEARARKICPRLENCNCSHSIFEFWLHPDRYKTFLCERGAGCNRPICFFAHREEELRELPQGQQRNKTMHKPGGGSSSGGEAGGSASTSSSVGRASRTTTPAGSSGNLSVAAAAPGQRLAYGYPQGGDGGGGGGGAVVMGAAPVHMQQPGGWYVSLPGGEQQQPQGPDGSLAPQSPSVLVQPGDGMRGRGQGQPPYAPAGYHLGPQPPPGAPPLMYGGPAQGYAPAAGQQQVVLGYQPVQGYVPGYGAAPPGVVLVRPGAQRGATVAVIPAGPSAWSGGTFAAADGEAPSLEALCAAMGQMAVPAAEPPQQEVLLQWNQQQQQQQQQPQDQPPQPLQHQHQQQGGGQVPVYAAAPLPAGAVLGGHQQQQPGQQLLPGQQVVVVMQQPEEGAQVGPWLQPSV